MPQTSTWNLPYPAGTLVPNVPADMQALAVATDTALSAASSVIGFIGEHKPTANVTGSGTTEKVGCFVTFNAVSGRRYKATWAGELNCTNSNGSSNLITNPATTRLRVKAGTDGTAVDGAVVTARDFAGLSNGYNLPCELLGTWTAPTTGQYTLCSTFNASNSAAGNVVQAFGATHTPLLLVECVGD